MSSHLGHVFVNEKRKLLTSWLRDEIKAWESAEDTIKGINLKNVKTDAAQSFDGIGCGRVKDDAWTPSPLTHTLRTFCDEVNRFA